jgi:hypothetical protein
MRSDMNKPIKDLGLSFTETIILVVVVVLAIFGIIYLFAN